jgi:hypothetical protein
MRLLYNISTQQLQPYPRNDDEEVIGLDPVYLVYTVIQNAEPAFDPATHHLEASETVDHGAKTVTRGWDVVAIEPQPAPPAAAYQVRAYLIRNGIDLASIPTLIASITAAGAERDEALMRWEFVANFPKNHPLVAAVAASLNLDLDQVWDSILAIE